MAANSVRSGGSAMSEVSEENVVLVYLTDATSQKTYTVKVSQELSEKLSTDMRLAQIILNNCIKESNAAGEMVSEACAEINAIAAENCDNDGVNSADNALIPEADDIDDIVSPEQEVSVTDDEEDGDGGKFNWSPESTLMFITEYERLEEKFRSGKMSKKACFELLSKNLNRQGIKVCGKKCSTKLLSLTRQYKAIVDHNSKSGNDKMRECPYFERMDQIFHKKPWVQPLSVASSSQVGESPTSISEQEHNDLRDEHGRKLNGERAKKKDFMHDFVVYKRKAQEDKEKYYQAKLARMDKMNELLAQLAAKQNNQEDIAPGC